MAKVKVAGSVELTKEVEMPDHIIKLWQEVWYFLSEEEKRMVREWKKEVGLEDWEVYYVKNLETGEYIE